MLQFDTTSWIIIMMCALMIGFSKAGIMGAGALVVPLLVSIMPARESTGFLLPMLSIGDITAIIYWHRHVDWSKLVRLMPWTLAGVVIGYICLGHITDELLMPLIGVIVLFLIVLHCWQQRRPEYQSKIPRNWWFAAVMGILAGGTSMLANAAGPIMVIYLLAMRLDKEEFIGTAACFFLLLNLSKIPFSSKLDLITPASLMTNLAVAPLIVLGGVLGVMAVHRIPQRAFDMVMQGVTALIALYLCLRPLL